MKKKKSSKIYIESRFTLFGSLGPEIRVKLPMDWTQDQMPGLSVETFMKAGAHAVFRPSKIKSAVFSPYLSLFAKNANPRMTLEDHRKFQVLDLKDKAKDFNLLSEAGIKISGLPGYKVIFLSKARGLDIKWFQVMAVGKQSVYYFTFGHEIKNFSRVSKAALDICKKVRIIEKVRLKLPDNATTLKLIRRTNKLILQAVRKKDFSLLYRTMDPDFKKMYSSDSFRMRFRDYWEKKDLMESLASKKPVFEYPPAIDLNNKLNISVYYIAKKRQLHLFELYSYRNRRWTLYNIAPSIKEI
ncbi:MAG: hypothetical protein KKH98_12020 [Spirochaetes bacterium]|nr:hypothetical protein [Spirochaetota bacterium]